MPFTELDVARELCRNRSSLTATLLVSTPSCYDTSTEEGGASQLVRESPNTLDEVRHFPYLETDHGTTSSRRGSLSPRVLQERAT